MRKIQQLLKLAANAATGNGKNDCRQYLIGAIAIRVDGAVVSARNISNNRKSQRCHAEARVLRKSGNCATVFVARVSRRDGSIQMAKPCIRCQSELRNRKIKKCYYTISNNEYGVMNFN